MRKKIIIAVLSLLFILPNIKAQDWGVGARVGYWKDAAFSLDVKKYNSTSSLEFIGTYYDNNNIELGKFSFDVDEVVKSATELKKTIENLKKQNTSHLGRMSTSNGYVGMRTLKAANYMSGLMMTDMLLGFVIHDICLIRSQIK